MKVEGMGGDNCSANHFERIEPRTTVLLSKLETIRFIWQQSGVDLSFEITTERDGTLFAKVTLKGKDNIAEKEFQGEARIVVGQQLNVGYYISDTWMPPPYAYINLADSLPELKDKITPTDESLCCITYDLNGLKVMSEYAYLDIVKAS